MATAQRGGRCPKQPPAARRTCRVLCRSVCTSKQRVLGLLHRQHPHFNAVLDQQPRHAHRPAASSRAGGAAGQVWEGSHKVSWTCSREACSRGACAAAASNQLSAGRPAALCRALRPCLPQPLPLTRPRTSAARCGARAPLPAARWRGPAPAPAGRHGWHAPGSVPLRPPGATAGTPPPRHPPGMTPQPCAPAAGLQCGRQQRVSGGECQGRVPESPPGVAFQQPFSCSTAQHSSAAQHQRL